MSPESQLPQYEPRVDRMLSSDPEAVERISNLLAEYSAKLKDIIDEIEQRRQRQLSLLSIFIVLVSGLVVGGSYLLRSELARSDVDMIILTLGGIALIASFFQRVFVEFASYRALRMSLDTSVLHLQQLVRRASQVEEHVERDFSRRLELDLRLTEAEVLLRYSYGITRHPPSPYSPGA